MGQANNKSTKETAQDNNSSPPEISQKDYYDNFTILNIDERKEFFSQRKNTIQLQKQLSFAMRDNNLELADFFISKGAPVTHTLPNNLPLLFLSQSPQMIDLLLEQDLSFKILDQLIRAICTNNNTDNNKRAKYLKTHPEFIQHLISSEKFIQNTKREFHLKKIFKFMIAQSNFQACRIILDADSNLGERLTTTSEIYKYTALYTDIKNEFLFPRLALNYNLMATSKKFPKSAFYNVLNEESHQHNAHFLLQHEALTNADSLVDALRANVELNKAVKYKLDQPILLVDMDHNLISKLQQYIDGSFLFILNYQFNSLNGYDVVLNHVNSNASKNISININVATLHAFIRKFVADLRCLNTPNFYHEQS